MQKYAEVGVKWLGELGYTGILGRGGRCEMGNCGGTMIMLGTVTMLVIHI
jgi:hypothetical protein